MAFPAYARTTLTLGDYHPTSNADEAGSAKLSQLARLGIDASMSQTGQACRRANDIAISRAKSHENQTNNRPTTQL